MIVIISILASLALPNFSKASEKAHVRDAQTVLSTISSAEKIYTLDEGRFGTDTDLFVNNHYLTPPDAGNSNPDWNFTVTSPTATTFLATATRTGGGYDGNTLMVDQTFDGTTYAGTHPLRNT